ncbi:MAG TPA: phytanoyl-CoA dioxygenase family protein, partial [Polyangiaceae bacterium]|nr:phytanoyl-CoA dioxygenase family protein [Polyangiaceae bacterium]
PWHKDSDYWHGRLEPQDVVTVWLAIDRSTAENGALKVIPGTHHVLQVSEYDPVDPVVNVFNTEIKRRTIDVDRAVTLELEPNQASLHHARMVHGSDPNKSELRRCGYTMRYMSTRTRLITTGRNGGHRIFLARGKDHANNHYADPNELHRHLLAQRRGPKGH